MAIKKTVFELGICRDIAYGWKGLFGAPGEKRQIKQKATPDQIKRQNQRNREIYMKRLIILNFAPGDLWLALKYPAGTRMSIKAIQKDRVRFFRELKAEYKRRGHILKYIYRLEIGKLGGIHFHCVINAIDGVDTGKLASGIWDKGKGYVDIRYLQHNDDYYDLAKYITKPAASDTGQMTMFDVEDKKAFMAYNCSRNLKRPEDVKRTYIEKKHWTMQKILQDGLKAKKGYYIDRDSVYVGVNSFNGMSFLHYTEWPLVYGKNAGLRKMKGLEAALLQKIPK